MNLWMSPVESDGVKKPQRGLDLTDLLGRHRPPLEPAFDQKRVRLHRFVEAGLVPVEMKDSATLQIEVDILAFGHREHMATGLDRETYSLKRVLSVIPNIIAELRHPRIFVPTRRRIHEKRRITPHHPLSPLPYRRHLIPYLGIACRELPAVRERGLHRRVTMLIEDRDIVAELAERVSGGYAGDSCADDADTSHHSILEARDTSNGR